MNKFYTDNFKISKINICVFVPSGSGQNIHKNRPSHGLVIQLSGERNYIFDDGSIMNVKKGDVFYLPKFSSYEVFNIEQGDCIAVNFDLYDIDTTYEHFSLNPSMSSKFEKDFYNILSNWRLQKSGYLNFCFSLLYGIISEIQKEAVNEYMPSQTKKLVDDAVSYILENISDSTLTIEKISEYLGVSPEYFRLIFKKSKKISPRKYIIEQRIKKAKQLILSDEFHICDIAEMCGYNSESYFSKEFKRICECSPSVYNKTEP